MVDNNIINVFAGMIKEIAYNITENRPTSKEDVKNFIIDLLHKCNESEREWILDEVDCYWK